MKKLLCITILALVVTGVLALSACGGKFESGWTYDDTHHWHKSMDANNTQVSGKAAHTFSDWTTTSQSTHVTAGQRERACKICKYVQKETVPATAVTTVTQLAEALNSATDGATINLTGTFAMETTVTISKSITLQGVDSATITGMPIYIAPTANVTFKNVTFSAPNNGGQTNNASCLYAVKYNGKLTVENCTFTNAPWDSMQITVDPTSTAQIVITGNTFNNTQKGYRYVHIESIGGVASGARVTLSNNTFNNVSKQYCQDSAITIYGITFANLTATGNSFRGDGATAEGLTKDVVWISNGIDQNDRKNPTDIGSIMPTLPKL